MSEGERRLAAIMYTDIVGYTSLTQKDEALAMQLLEEHRRLVRPFFPKHNGREIKTVGDEFLIEFSSALEAVRCAFDIQQSMHEINGGRLPEKQVQIRIGVHLGDVIHSQNDVYGDAVNVASRIEPLAMPGGICISEQVYDHVKNKFEFPLTSIGKRELKNVGEPMEVYKVVLPWEKSASTEVASYPTSRIAILPFASFSSNPDDAYFADGVTDEIISAVAGISGLSVISRTSVVGYKGTAKKVKEIGRELEVGSILEGTFKKAGNRIRVTTQLIDVAQDKHLWAQNYDRSLDDVFEVQSDVAKQVADALRVRILSPEKERIEKKPTESTVAYTLYLKGRQLWNKRGLDNVREALAYFERAVKEDPNFALGYVGQADCYLVAQDLYDIEWAKKAKTLVSKALELDPDLAEAHATNGGVLANEYDLRHAEEEFKKAIELKPSYATAHQWYQLNVLRPELRWDEALQHIEKAVELDPLSPVMHLNLGAYYMAKRDYGRAIEPCKRALELGMASAGGSLAWAYGMLKMYDQRETVEEVYAEYVKDALKLPRIRTLIDANTAYLKGDRETVRRLIPELESYMQETGAAAYDVARLYLFLGEDRKGFEWLERSYSKKESALLNIKSDEFLDGVRTDPRYLGLLKRLGLDQTAKQA